MIDAIARNGYAVSGDLADLMPARVSSMAVDASRCSDKEIAAATMSSLVEMTAQYADLWLRTRRREAANEVNIGGRLASWGRAASFRARIRALRLADTNKVLGKIAHRHLRR
jgi:hypothetical protein